MPCQGWLGTSPPALDGRQLAQRPGCVDAFTSMAMIEISRKKFDDATAELAKALQLLPGDPGTPYYRAIGYFEAVLAKYPRAKAPCASRASPTS